MGPSLFRSFHSFPPLLSSLLLCVCYHALNHLRVGYQNGLTKLNPPAYNLIRILDTLFLHLWYTCTVLVIVLPIQQIHWNQDLDWR